MGAIIKREMSSYFSSPIGYIYLAVFYLFAGFFFYMTTLQAGSTDLRGVFINLFSVLMFLIPILTMRLISEDKRQKTDQALLTAPLTLGGLVFGKFIAAFIIFAMGVAVTLVFAVVVSFFAQPDWAVVLSNMLGLLLLGGALISIGLFISSLTENQVIAAIGSFAALMFLSFIDSIAAAIPISFLSTIVKGFSFYEPYNTLTMGKIGLSPILFFISVALLFNYLTIRVFERRRWS